MILHPLDLQLGDVLSSGHYVSTKPLLLKSGFVEVTLKTPGGAATVQTFNPKQRLEVTR